MSPAARDVMIQCTECVAETDSVAAVAQRMVTLNVAAMPICGEGDRLIGVITVRDIVITVVTQGHDPQQVTVAMVTEGGEVVTIGADDPLEDARRTMEEHQVRHLAVIDGHRLVGIISQGDLAKALPHDQTGQLVESIWKDSPPACETGRALRVRSGTTAAASRGRGVAAWPPIRSLVRIVR